MKWGTPDEVRSSTKTRWFKILLRENPYRKPAPVTRRKSQNAAKFNYGKKFSNEAKVGICRYKHHYLGIHGDAGWQVQLHQRSRLQPLLSIFDSVAGLALDVPVEIAGVEVGRVRNIALEANRAMVTLKMRPEIQLTKDAKAIIRTKGILGDKYIELIRGSDAAPLIEPGGHITQTIPTTDIDSLLNVGFRGSRHQKSEPVALQCARREEGERSIKQILDNVQEMAQTLNDIVQKNNEDISTIVGNFTIFSERLKEIGNANTDDIRSIVDNVRRASENLETLITGLHEITVKVNEGKGSIGQLINDDQTVRTNDALASLKGVTEKINKGEGSIGKLVNDDQTVDNLNDALTGINDYIKKQDAYRTFLDYRGEYLFESEEAKSYLSLRIQPREDKYWPCRSWMIPAEKSTTEYTRTLDGDVHHEQIIEVEKDELKFSAQIAKRYYDIAFRGGLFESTAEALDYYMYNDRLMFSFEAFDFDADTNPHLKFKADYIPFQHIYLICRIRRFHQRRRR